MKKRKSEKRKQMREERKRQRKQMRKHEQRMRRKRDRKENEREKKREKEGWINGAQSKGEPQPKDRAQAFLGGRTDSELWQRMDGWGATRGVRRKEAAGEGRFQATPFSSHFRWGHCWAGVPARTCCGRLPLCHPGRPAVPRASPSSPAICRPKRPSEPQGPRGELPPPWTHRRTERLLAPMSWQPCWIPAIRYGTNLWMEPLSWMEPETPCATFTLSPSLQGKAGQMLRAVRLVPSPPNVVGLSHPSYGSSSTVALLTGQTWSPQVWQKSCRPDSCPLPHRDYFGAAPPSLSHCARLSCLSPPAQGPAGLRELLLPWGPFPTSCPSPPPPPT